MKNNENAKSTAKIIVNWESPQSDDRNKIMHISTQIESGIADLLKLAIGDYDHESISFGYSSSALSLAARINLLLDFNIFTKDEKKYFDTFTQIRNKFAHNHRIKNLHEFLTTEKDRKILNTLERSFKGIIENYSTSEINTWKLYQILINNIELSLNKFFHKLIANAQNKGIIDFRNSFFEEFDTLVSDIDFINSLQGNSMQVVIDLYKELNRRVALRTKSTEQATEDMRGKSLFA
ncbi:hypothetical protein D3C87_778180 [compost metagenome]